MSDHSIFLAALDITDPSERAEYLTRATGGDAALRRQVEGLLAAHQRSGEFLEVPALRQMVGSSGPDPASSPRSGEIDLSFLQPSTKPSSLGRLAHYEIEQVIGSGGCGIVLKAFDERLARVVAIKVMAPELAATSPARKRFLREARAAAAIRHENVISIHAVEDLPIPFLVMEHIAGQTLQEKLDETGPLDVREVLQIGQQIASGLAAAHSLGLIHRDIKPGNVLLERGSGRIKITDFGLARSADDASVTQSGVIAGTPLYMSPEQAQGAAIDQRSDLFSLGSVLYVMASGRPPFRAATTLAVLQRVAEDQPRPIQEIIPETPPWLTAIITKLHAKQPGDRYASAQELADVLARCQAELQQKGRVEFLEGASPPAQPTPKHAPPPTEYIELPPSRSESKSAPTRRRPQPATRWLTAAAAVVILLLLGLSLTEAGGVTNVTGTVVRLVWPDGTLVVEVDDPRVSLTIEGEDVVIKGAGVQEIRLRPGQYKLRASQPGRPDRQEIINIKTGGRQVLNVRQEFGPPAGATTIQRASSGVSPARFTNSLGMEFALVPKGKAWLGGGGGKPGDQEVEFPEDFYLGVYEVTREEWETVMGKQFYQPAPQIARRNPVERVTWDACQRFVTLLNAQTRESGWVYRLPTEREWEYACRGGPMTDKFDGAFDFYFDKPVNTLTPDMANCSPRKDPGKRVWQVGSYEPNRLGLYDMHGNVMEWCQDKAPSDPKDPPGTVRRVLRGGSWWVLAEHCRAAAFASATVDPAWKEHIGFRVARVRRGLSDSDADRRAAEWVLSISGSVRGASEPGRLIKAGEQIPPGEWKLIMANVVGNPRATDAELAVFENCRKLSALYLSDTPVTDAGLVYFKDSKDLLTLELAHTAVTDKGLAVFKDHKRLEQLNLIETRVTDMGLLLLGNRNVYRLLLAETNVGDAGLAVFKDSEKLITLDLRETRVTDVGLAHFRGCQRLEHVHLDGAPVGDFGVAIFKDCKSLSGLMLHGTQVSDAGLEHITKIKSLAAVGLSQTKVTTAGVKKLAAARPDLRIEWDGGVIDPNKTEALPAPSAALEALRREQIPPDALTFAGGGDPAKAPASLVAVLGEPRPIHTAGISSIAFSADGRWVATAAGGDNSILLREAATGKVRRVLRGHAWTVRFVAFLPDSATLVSGSADETVKVWSTENEDEPATLPLGVKAEWIAVSPDGRFLAAVSRGEVRLWDWGAWDKPTVLPAVEGGKPAALAFSGDGETLACGWRVEKSESPISLYRTDDGTLKETMHGHPDNLASVAFSPDGKYLASAQGGKTRLWDLATSQIVRELDEALRVCFSPDSQRLVLGGHSGFLVCDTNSGKEVETARKRVSWGAIGALAFSHDGRTLGVADSSAAARFYDTSTWKPQAALSEPGHGCPVDALAVSPDGRKVLTRGRDHMLRQWLIDAPNEHPIVHEYEKVDRLLAYSSDGMTFVTAESPPLTVWDAATNQPLTTIPVTLYSLAYSPDGKLIAGNGIGDDMVYLCDVRSGQIVHRFPSIKEQAFSVDFSRDGGLIATAGNKGWVAVWNVATGAEVASWTTTPMKSIAFHPDGSLVTGHHDGTIAFWDAATGAQQRTCQAHSGAVHRLRFTPDGRTLLSSGVDGVIQVRSPEHDRARAVIPVGFTGLPVVFDLDASGQYLFASGPTSVIYVHRLPEK